MAAKIKFKQIRGIIRGKKKATKKKVIVATGNIQARDLFTCSN